MKHEKSTARLAAVKFLYQCESEKIFYFSDSRFRDFCSNFGVEGRVLQNTQDLVKGVLGEIEGVDDLLNKHSKKWSVQRMPSIDRCTLRLACHELLASHEPIKVILNEAIEIAKEYGTENSGKFVNGILDSIARTTRN